MYLKAFSNESELFLNHIDWFISYCLRFASRYVAFADKLPLAIFSAFICLGKKYDIRTLYVEATKKLFQEIPVNLAEFDGPAHDTWLMIEDPEYMDVAILARKAGLLSVLPLAIYLSCCEYSSEQITNGLQMPDGSTIHLSVQDTIMCLRAHRAICELQAETTFAWLSCAGSVCAYCPTAYECMITKSDWVFANLIKPGIKALDKWDELGMEGLCDKCSAVGQEEFQKGREQFWEQLPDVLGLPPWAELLKERADM